MNSSQLSLKFILYARKSSEAEDRQVASIDSQIEEMTRVVQRDGMEIVTILSESQSAKAPGRLIFNQMLTMIKSRKANGILCWKLDRLARNPVDGGQITWLLQNGTIQQIQTIDRVYSPQDNVLMMSVEFGMANQFVRDLSVNTKRGLKAKVERGWMPGILPLGYLNNPYTKKGQEEIITDEKRFNLTRKMFDLMLSGNYTVPQILQIANEEWKLRNKYERKIGRTTLYRLFTTPFYYGMFEYPLNSGNWYKGKHNPMITMSEYDKIQNLLGRQGRPRGRNNEFAFTGMIRCAECGAMITAEEKFKRQKNGNMHYYTYYHCTKKIKKDCSQKSVRIELLEEQINDVLDRITIPSHFRDWALAKIKEENQAGSQNRKDILVNLRKEYDACVKKIDGLIEMRASGEISEEVYRRKNGDLTLKKLRAEELIRDNHKRTDDWYQYAEQLFVFGERAKEIFEKGNLQTKKSILAILGSNLLLNNGKLLVELPEPLIWLEKLSQEEKKISVEIRRLEPHKFSQNKSNMGAFYSQSSELLGDRDSNPN